ncbi:MULTISPECIES: hypothetical protein [Streptomyces]|uniref:Uncharacterized protein n=1 Tax=Streptomyces evansiae TaxID=3075535 RepID=A0ABU2QXA5_9ACTN|nr:MULTISPECIES: hypothetical protein [unclassified Streptomyces]MDT0409093.1 hypothetical protein [Streptomyces sp. DSM 41979]MDT0424199.1 hypothetical protein [Streptomyces sp. DSM 41859]MYQ59071.1 hypothetical protein [Streptomyces sp. SID4926]WEH25953.1 hypothetical protein P0D76_00710 [Streptomyces sp. AM 3-1-1]SCE57212.1 hypothetical protein GA0115252_167817 [Streptomyces sp. DfronAA-171]
MGEQPPKAPGEHGRPLVPRDLPDQQRTPGEDPLDVSPPPARDGSEELPDTDEGGTGRAGRPHTGDARGTGPAPQESSG